MSPLITTHLLSRCVSTKAPGIFSTLCLTLGVLYTSVQAAQSPDLDYHYSRPVYQLSHELSEGSERWAVALDEVAWMNTEGVIEFERIAPHAAMRELGNWMAEHERNKNATARLVVYNQSEDESDRGLATTDVVVTLHPDTSPDDIAILLNAEHQGELPYAPGKHHFTTSNSIDTLMAADRLKPYAGIQAVEPQIARWLEFTAIPNDPLYKNQWHLKNTGQTGSDVELDLNVEPAWDMVRGRNVIIGIVDSGLAADHPDLIDNVRTDLGYDFRDGDDDPSPFLGIPNQQDLLNDPREDSHGTLVAGVAAGRGFNGIGGSGVAPEAGIADIRLIGDYMTDLQEASAINHRNDAIDIKNNSWGPRDNGASLGRVDELAKAAIFDAVTNGRDGHGTIFIWSAGNGARFDDNANKGGYANSRYTIAVAALDDNGKRAAYSEMGPNILVTAPAGDRRGKGTVTSDLQGDDGLNLADYPNELEDPAYTKNFIGTSSSAPMIAGVVALMLEANPNLGWRDVQEILIRSSRKIDESADSWFTNSAGFAFSDEYGAGLPDAYEAVMLANSWDNLAPQRSAGRNLQIDDPIELPDASGGPFERSFSFEGTQLRVEQATLTVFLDHPFRGEVLVELESPAGTVSQLVGRNDDDNRGYFDWTFSTVQFWGESADGIWKLRIVDGTEGNVGELWQASMELHGTEEASASIPNTPRDLRATTSTANSIRLDWKDLADNESGYRVELATGLGSPWQVIDELGPNRTFHRIDFVPQGRDIYFRVVALNGSEQSGYSNVAHTYVQDGDGAVLYQSNFEPEEGYNVNSGLDSLGWRSFPEGFTHPAHGVLADEFSSRGKSGHGQQAYVGKTWRGGSLFSSIGHLAPYDPIPNTNVQMNVLFSLSDSSNGASDLFGFDLFNQDGFLLCRIMFDNSTGDAYYATQRTIGSITGDYKGPLVTLNKNQVYELEVSMNLESGQWSGSIESNPIAINLPLQPLNESVAMNLGSVEAFWQVLDSSNAGNNYMLFDDLRITQKVISAPEPPSDFEAEAISSSIIYLSWDHHLVAEQYEIQRSEDGENNWTTVATVAEDTLFYIDPFLPINTEYFYRIRTISSAGDSLYHAPQNARTYTEYEDWKDGHRLEINASNESDADNDKIPLLAEYALRLNPRLISNGGVPTAVEVDGKPGLRYFRARKEIDYVVEASSDLINWSTEGVDQEGEILGLFVTAVTSPDSDLRFFRLWVTEKE